MGYYKNELINFVTDIETFNIECESFQKLMINPIHNIDELNRLGNNLMCNFYCITKNIAQDCSKEHYPEFESGWVEFTFNIDTEYQYYFKTCIEILQEAIKDIKADYNIDMEKFITVNYE
jgi:hypothetical protein